MFYSPASAIECLALPLLRAIQCGDNTMPIGLKVAVYKTCSGLEIRVVLWPQSTKTSVGPPDSARWWSGGLLENSP